VEKKYHSISCTSQYFSKGLYSRGGKGSLLLFDHRIQDKKAAEKSQPKSIGDIVNLVIDARNSKQKLLMYMVNK
jgi:hypothetical protein